MSIHHSVPAALEDGVSVPYQRTCSSNEYAKLREGLQPRDMDDKWQMQFRGSTLFMRRSWTGETVYEISFMPSDDGASVREALCIARLSKMYGVAYCAAHADFLIGNLLLGESKPFLIPPGAKSAKGLLQHVMAGTGYPERHWKSPPWWKFWRSRDC